MPTSFVREMSARSIGALATTTSPRRGATCSTAPSSWSRALCMRGTAHRREEGARSRRPRHPLVDPWDRVETSCCRSRARRPGSKSSDTSPTPSRLTNRLQQRHSLRQGVRRGGGARRPRLPFGVEARSLVRGAGRARSGTLWIQEVLTRSTAMGTPSAGCNRRGHAGCPARLHEAVAQR